MFRRREAQAAASVIDGKNRKPENMPADAAKKRVKDLTDGT